MFEETENAIQQEVKAFEAKLRREKEKLLYDKFYKQVENEIRGKLELEFSDRRRRLEMEFADRSDKLEEEYEGTHKEMRQSIVEYQKQLRVDQSVELNTRLEKAIPQLRETCQQLKKSCKYLTEQNHALLLKYEPHKAAPL